MRCHWCRALMFDLRTCMCTSVRKGVGGRQRGREREKNDYIVMCRRLQSKCLYEKEACDIHTCTHMHTHAHTQYTHNTLYNSQQVKSQNTSKSIIWILHRPVRPLALRYWAPTKSLPCKTNREIKHQPGNLYEYHDSLLPRRFHSALLSSVCVFCGE